MHQMDKHPGAHSDAAFGDLARRKDVIDSFPMGHPVTLDYDLDSEGMANFAEVGRRGQIEV